MGKGRGIVWTLMVFVLMAGCGESELEGPERTRFEEVNELSMKVDRGDVTIFGQGEGDGATVDRWHSGKEAFEAWELRQVGREVVARARCVAGMNCRSRFELELAADSSMDIDVERGDIRLYRGAGPLRLRVDRGDVEAVSMRHSRVDMEVGRGDGELHFEEAPDHLRLVLGVEATATVTLPRQRYRCDFELERVNFEGIEELQCHGQVTQGLEIVPEDAQVRLRFED